MLCDQCPEYSAPMSKDSYWNTLIIDCRKPVIILITTCQCLCNSETGFIFIELYEDCSKGCRLVVIDLSFCHLLTLLTVLLLVFSDTFPI